MDRPTKEQEVKNLADRFQKSKSTILADYRGLTVAQMTKLRGRLAKESSFVKVVKNRLLKKALKDIKIEGLDEYLVGPTIIAGSDKDPVSPAKILVEFSKDNENLKIKAGWLSGGVLSLAKIKELASLPSREELYAKLLRTLNAPASNLVSVLAAVPRQLAQVIGAIRDKKQQSA